MRCLISILLVYGLFAAAPAHGVRTKSPVAIARSCRTGVAHALQSLARLGLRELDRCERKKAAGRTARDCTSLKSGGDKATPYRLWEHRAAAIIDARCPLDTTARAPFPGKRLPSGTVVGDPLSAIQIIGETIEASGRGVRPSPAAGIVAARESSIGRCTAAVASARTLVASATMKSALHCQRDRERGAVVVGALAPDCQKPPADDVIRTAAGHIAEACDGVAGLRVGSCDSLPRCALDAAVETGVELARIVAGQCGNGVLDAGEECDDGNDVSTDSCNQCVATVCGNGIVEGDEECDDGNPIDFDGCTDCKVAVCGDGVREGSEECDDGNDVGFDGCTGCRFDPVACSSAGVVATVTFDYDPDQFVQIAGMRLRLQYDATGLSIPGRLVGPSINQRVKNLTGLSAGLSFSVADRDFLPSEDAPDGVDDTLQTIIAVSPGFIPPGPFEQIRFDCLGADARVSQLACSVATVTDPFLNKVPDATTAMQTRCSITLETAPEQ
jgi:cysteine-rich repeat protein